MAHLSCMYNKFWLLSFLVMFVASFPTITLSQSLAGTTGYFNIPSAEIHPDKTMYFGSTLLHKEYKKIWEKLDYHAMAFYGTVTFLPFLELSARVTRLVDMPSAIYKHSTVDRMASFRLQVFREKKYSPSVLIGAHNFASTLSNGGASHFNATYIVTTKNFNIPNLAEILGLTVGYGSKAMPARDYQFVGFFAGVNIVPNHFKYLHLFLEYDGDKWNTGTQIIFLKHLIIMGGLEGFDSFSGGINYIFHL